jgi:hypothetical protein
MSDLSNYPLAVIFVIGLAAILIVSEIGWQLGKGIRSEAGRNFTTLESSMLALLALMLALPSRWCCRDAVLNEANAIGTTALRARLLPEPQRSETLKLLREYVQIRLDIVQRGTSLAELTPALDRSNALQEALCSRRKPWHPKTRGSFPGALYTVAEWNDGRSGKKTFDTSQPNPE